MYNISLSLYIYIYTQIYSGATKVGGAANRATCYTRLVDHIM